MGQLEVLQWLRQHGRGTAHEMAEDLDMSVSRVFQSIRRLEERNMLEVKRIRNGWRKMVYIFVSGD